MKTSFSPKELAQAIGVSESSLRRWVDNGAIQTTRTVGGHRRIPLVEAVQFIRRTQTPVVRPDVIGLPPSGDSIGIARDASDLEERLYHALKDGQAETARSLFYSSFLSSRSLTALFDGPIRGAMERIGRLWEHSSRGILIEHRATDICIEVINQFRQLCRHQGEGLPVALGAAPGNDIYTLPTLMAATVLADVGFDEVNFGPDTPLELLSAAADEYRPKLVWLSLSVLPERHTVRQAIHELGEHLARTRTPLIIGGRQVGALDGRLRSNIHIMHSMGELAGYARAMASGQSPDAAHV
jgi:MerR family transcriptional regulator, light-induced transcriptional regulator